jgi:hypothetical protein
MPVINRFADLAPTIAAWRRDLHAHPEILFDTHRTSALVAERLRAAGCDEVATGIGRTGVVGVIRGRETGSGRVIGLRADMDALPMQEATGLPHASRTPGAMHACGHDGHTAMLLGAAQYLAETRNFDGTAVVIFQPAEEGGGGGREMVEDGMMDRFGIQEVYGMHNMPGRPVGDFAIRPGGLMAASDEFTKPCGGPATGVEPVDGSAAGFGDDREEVRAEAVARRLHQRHRGAGGDRGIDGVAAALQHIEPDLGRERMAGRDDPVLRDRHRPPGLVRLPRRPLRGIEDGGERDCHGNHRERAKVHGFLLLFFPRQRHLFILP